MRTCATRVLCSVTRQGASQTLCCRALTWRQIFHAPSSVQALQLCQSCSGWTWREQSLVSFLLD